MKFIELTFVIVTIVTIANSCDIYLTKSRIPGVGRGIFAGRDFAEGEQLLYSPSLLVYHNYSVSNQLDNYVFSTGEENFHLVSMNYVCVVNHADEINVVRYLHNTVEATPASIQINSPHSVYSAVDAKAMKSIKAGEELFLTYGTQHWFNVRFSGAIEYFDPANHDTSIPVSEISSEPGYLHCVSDVYAAPSKLTIAGEGLFARRGFLAGEIVNISPVLSLPVSSWKIGIVETVLNNYLIWKPRSHVAFLPLGHVASVNHATGAASNVKLAWYEWAPGDLHRAFNMSVTQLLSEKLATFDVQLVATRDIEADEEILLDYGMNWLVDWSNYLALRVEWLTATQAGEEKPLPLFRYPIEAPESMEFPPHWFG